MEPFSHSETTLLSDAEADFQNPQVALPPLGHLQLIYSHRDVPYAIRSQVLIMKPLLVIKLSTHEQCQWNYTTSINQARDPSHHSVQRRKRAFRPTRGKIKSYIDVY